MLVNFLTDFMGIAPTTEQIYFFGSLFLLLILIMIWSLFKVAFRLFQ